MTKQKAWQLAKEKSLLDNLLPTCAAMEIYAEAFAEWIDGQYFQVITEDGKYWMEVYESDCPADRVKEYTTTDLIKLFEQEN